MTFASGRRHEFWSADVRWRRLYGEEVLARKEAALWLHGGRLTLEHAGQALSRYDVEQGPGGRLTAVARPRLFETPFALPQSRLFPLDAFGETGWLMTLRLPDYAPREPHRPPVLQEEVLFPYPDALYKRATVLRLLSLRRGSVPGVGPTRPPPRPGMGPPRSPA